MSLYSDSPARQEQGTGMCDAFELCGVQAVSAGSGSEHIEPEENGELAPLSWGTIYTSAGEQRLQDIENVRSSHWTEEDESAYLARVKEKAVGMAAKILADARAEAAFIAEDAHAKAYDEGYSSGYAEGLSVAQGELDELRTNMADSVAAVLSAIEGQCSHIFAQWREELIGVTRLAVEKMTGIVLHEDRKLILAQLLENAVALLEKRRELTIYVNGEDEPMMQDILTNTRDAYPDVRSWRVRTDHSVSPGGMLVESESSLAESIVESRIEAVNQVLAHLTLPEVIHEP